MDIHIFVAEDDEHIGNTIKAFLQDAGYYVELCPDGNIAQERLYDAQFQLVILDIMLPGFSPDASVCQVGEVKYNSKCNSWGGNRPQENQRVE